MIFEDVSRWYRIGETISLDSPTRYVDHNFNVRVRLILLQWAEGLREWGVAKGKCRASSYLLNL